MSRQRLVRRQHPLFSPVAIVATFGLLLVLGVILWRTGGQAFSPGALSAQAHRPGESGGFANHAAFADDCFRCHEPLVGLTADRCEACHTLVQEQRQNGVGMHAIIETADCTQCHTEHAGAAHDLFGSAFDQFSEAHHQAIFALSGRHAELDCQACHQEEQYAGTPNECAGCHTEPALHEGVFGRDCEACHTETSWQPAQLVSHQFPLDHGEEGQLACATCHQQTFTRYTCTGCHESSAMEEHHLEEGITAAELSDCTNCHPTGQEEELDEIFR